MPKLTHEILTQLLSYDPNTGIFRWKETRGRAVIGAVAGNINSGGYIQIKIFKRLYKAHRLAWFYVHAVWPASRLDHRDNNGSNNRISNIRPASHSQNMANRKLNCNNTSGLKGVSPFKDKFMANINHKGKRFYLGLFERAEDAHIAYVNKSIELFGEFARAA